MVLKPRSSVLSCMELSTLGELNFPGHYPTLLPILLSGIFSGLVLGHEQIPSSKAIIQNFLCQLPFIDLFLRTLLRSSLTLKQQQAHLHRQVKNTFSCGQNLLLVYLQALSVLLVVSLKDHYLT